ncbi:MAG: hypothetical protein IJQ98_02230 [Oscillospiraceae bacterium]|nr:hypothetical protein [Oscillospiraceae bacterium]
MSNFRITTNGLFRTYRTNLNKNNQKLNHAMLGVETQRKFNTYAEDPAAASKAWRLRRSYWRTGDQIDNNNYAISKYESAYTAMGSIVDGDVTNSDFGMGLSAILSAVEGVSDTSGSARTALGKEMLQAADNIVSMMNTKYGDEFVFAGADGQNIPFEWSEDGSRLLYRGIDVSTEEPKSLEDFGITEEELDGLTTSELSMEEPDPGDAEAVAKYEKVKPFVTEPDPAAYTDGENDPDYQTALSKYQRGMALKNYAEQYQQRNGVTYEQGTENYAKLQSMAKETTYVDIGIGMLENGRGELIDGSAFNTAVSGLKFLGYGRDNNVVMVIKELGEIFKNADPETGNYADDEKDRARADELLNLLHNTVRASQDQHTQLSADAKYLQTNLKQLETNKNELDKQIVDVEDLDMAEAITSMSWAQYCYNAALRIGTNILSQSLIDYMN